MGSTYETDSIGKQGEIGLALQAAVIVKQLANLIGCRSWLVARLTIKEIRQLIDELAKAIEDGSK